MVFEASKVAVSVVALGTVGGVQFVAVFQSLVAGFKFQVALSAKIYSRIFLEVKPRELEGTHTLPVCRRVACAQRVRWLGQT